MKISNILLFITLTVSLASGFIAIKFPESAIYPVVRGMLIGFFISYIISLLIGIKKS